jgi:hypothetical protein
VIAWLAVSALAGPGPSASFSAARWDAPAFHVGAAVLPGGAPTLSLAHSRPLGDDWSLRARLDSLVVIDELRLGVRRHAGDHLALDLSAVGTALLLPGATAGLLALEPGVWASTGARWTVGAGVAAPVTFPSLTGAWSRGRPPSQRPVVPWVAPRVGVAMPLTLRSSLDLQVGLAANVLDGGVLGSGSLGISW